MRDEAGFTLVGLMVAVAIVNLALAAAVTSWVTVDRRAREAELIWRGQQIARAIDCYSAANTAQPLERLEELVEVGCLRRVYGDPMVRDGEWHILTQQDLADGTIAALLGLADPSQEAGEAAVTGALGEGGSAIGAQLGAPGFGQQSGGGRAPGAGLGGGRLGAGVAGSRTLIGVVSTSLEEGLRTYQGRTRHGEWVFLAAGTS